VLKGGHFYFALTRGEIGKIGKIGEIGKIGTPSGRQLGR
jgi:hypothetical protein